MRFQSPLQEKEEAARGRKERAIKKEIRHATRKRPAVRARSVPAHLTCRRRERTRQLVYFARFLSLFQLFFCHPT